MYTRSLALLGWSLMMGCQPDTPRDLAGPVEVAPDWQAAVGATRFQLFEHPQLTFRNPIHALHATFDDAGAVSISASRDGGVRAVDGPWATVIRTARWGRAGHLASVVAEPTSRGACASERADATGDCLRRAELRSPGLVEWWTNDERGLEQGWTVEAPPEGAGPLVFEVEATRGTWTVDPSAARLTVDGATLHYRDLAAFDADGTALPIHLAGGGRSVTVQVDDTGARYPLTVDPVIRPAAWSVESDQADAMLGNTVSSAGDVNGDGFADVLVAAPGFDTGVTDAGMVMLFLGSPTGIPATAAWTATGTQEGERFGAAVAAGDHTGDGLSDVMIGAPGHDDTHTDEGMVFVYYGLATSEGLSPIPRWFLPGGAATANQGASLDVGDINGDGFGDILVGAPGFDSSGADRGRVQVFAGSAFGPLEPALWSATGDAAGYRFGLTVLSPGDIDADGFDDIVVGSPDNGYGRVWMFEGGVTPDTDFDWTALGADPDSGFGEALAGGDVDGDGFSDVLVGAPRWDDVAVDEGRAFLYRGRASGLNNTPSWQVGSAQAGAALGTAVAVVDTNSDGYADAVVGVPGWDDTAADNGRVHIHNGGTSGLKLGVTLRITSPHAGARFGAAVAAAGDVDGDGSSDILAGSEGFTNGQAAEGLVELFHGSPEYMAEDPSWSFNPAVSGGFGRAINAAGDVNGDGFDDVILGCDTYSDGQANEGAVMAIHGGPTVPDGTPDWFVESDLVDAGMGYEVAAAGDVNGDGYADVLVTSNLIDRVEVYHGSPAGLETTAAWSATGATAFGDAIATAGDVNGDGFSDVLIGDPTPGSPQVLVYHGSAAGLAGSPTVLTGLGSGAFGTSVASAGDKNADGYDDVIVGDPASLEAHVFLGSASGLAATADLVLTGTQSEYGNTVAGIGDYDGDGYDDYAIGTPTSPSTLQLRSGVDDTVILNRALGGNRSTTRLFSPGDLNGDGYSDVVSGSLSDLLRVYYGPGGGAPDQYFGGTGREDWDVGPAGDFNGDGVDDVIGANLWENTVYLQLGGANEAFGGHTRAWGLSRRALRPGTSTPVAHGMRSTVDGAFDLEVTGARGVRGRARARVAVEAKPVTVPFDGTGLRYSATFDTVGGTGTVSMDGLIPGEGYKWRFRTVVDAAHGTDGAGRWIVAGHGSETDLRPRAADFDQDGEDANSDCDDTDPTVYTGAPEVCDAVDSNCDGSLVDGFDDFDGDTDPDCIDDDDDNDGDPDLTDCDDFDTAVYTGAAEACDLVDSNCDGSLVDGFDNLDSDPLPDCVDHDDDNDGVPDAGDSCLTVDTVRPDADFADISTLTLNGDASQVDTLIELTPQSQGRAGSAFLTDPLPLSPSLGFSTSFEIQSGGGNGGCGTVFVIHADPAGASALGNQGLEMGYGGISTSVGIEFDEIDNGTWDPDDYHVSILTNGGVVVPVASALLGFALDDGLPTSVWVDYDAGTATLDIYAAHDSAIRPATPVLSHTGLALDTIVGPEAWFGFTAGNGGAFARHTLNRWRLDFADADQSDTDLDGFGDVCDACYLDDAYGDDDGDGLCNLALQVTDLEGGAPATLAVQNAEPGATVVFFVSKETGSGPCLDANTCLGLRNVKQLGAATANAAGTASLGLNVPDVPAGRTVYFQAAWRRGQIAELSSVVTKTTL